MEAQAGETNMASDFLIRRITWVLRPRRKSNRQTLPCAWKSEACPTPVDSPILPNGKPQKAASAIGNCHHTHSKYSFSAGWFNRCALVEQ